MNTPFINYHQEQLQELVNNLMAHTPTTEAEEQYQSVVSMICMRIDEGRLADVFKAIHAHFPEYYRAEPPMPQPSDN